MTIVLKMIDEARTPVDFKRCCTLVREQINSGHDGYINSVLINTLMLKAVWLIANKSVSPQEATDMCQRAMTTYRCDPPRRGELTA